MTTIDFALKIAAIACFVFAAYCVVTAPKKLSTMAMWYMAEAIAGVVVQWTTGTIQIAAFLILAICMAFCAIASIRFWSLIANK